MNAKSNIPDYQHEENRKLAKSLRAEGYRLEVTSQQYQVWAPDGKCLGGAGTIKKPHGRYAEANLRDYLQMAIQTALRSK